MPPEAANHERTLMAWPCRRELWGEQLEAAKVEYAGVANLVAGFEPLTMVVSSPADADEARSALAGEVEIVEIPLDDSWMRDNGPIFCLDEQGRRAGVHFGFNAWGGKFSGWDRDENAGGVLAARYGDALYKAPLILEGGSIIVDAVGRLVTTEQCLLNVNRNPEMSKAEIEDALRQYLGVSQVVWLGRGLYEDRDTDGHVDLIAAFTDAGKMLLQCCPISSPDHESMADNRQRAVNAGLEVLDFLPLAHGEIDGHTFVHSYLNFYLCNGAAIVPLAGNASPETDEQALDLLAHALPGREIIGTPGLTTAFGGGGPHCITQQIPSKAAQS
jgi:agmatine deiminase